MRGAMKWPCPSNGQCTKNHALPGQQVSSKILRQRAAVQVPLDLKAGGGRESRISVGHRSVAMVKQNHELTRRSQGKVAVRKFWPQAGHRIWRRSGEAGTGKREGHHL